MEKTAGVTEYLEEDLRRTGENVSSCHRVSGSSWPAVWEAVHPRKKPQACPSHFLSLLSLNNLTASGAKFLPSEGGLRAAPVYFSSSLGETFLCSPITSRGPGCRAAGEGKG